MLKAIENQNTTLIKDVDMLDKQLKLLLETASVRCIPGGEGRPADHVDVDVLRGKCQDMEAQITTLNMDSILLLPNDHDVRYHVLKRDFETRIRQYRECLEFLEYQDKYLDQQYESEEMKKEELQAIIRVATSKLSETNSYKPTREEVCDRIQKKCDTLGKINNEHRKQMNEFLDKNFPLPDEATFSKVKRKTVETVNGRQLTRRENLLPLKTLVQMLISRCIDNPNDPYLELDHTCWPLYVELLLACGVTLLHPVDSNRLKLMPFHL